jgi:uncharacterized membrane protein
MTGMNGWGGLKTRSDFHKRQALNPSATHKQYKSRQLALAVGFVVVWFFTVGIARFVLTETEMRIVPPGIPWPRAAVLASGVFELLGAAGLLWPRTRRAAAWGLFALTLAITLAHIYMLHRPAMSQVAAAQRPCRRPRRDQAEAPIAMPGGEFSSKAHKLGQQGCRRAKSGTFTQAPFPIGRRRLQSSLHPP